MAADCGGCLPGIHHIFGGLRVNPDASMGADWPYNSDSQREFSAKPFAGCIGCRCCAGISANLPGCAPAFAVTKPGTHGNAGGWCRTDIK